MQGVALLRAVAFAQLQAVTTKQAGVFLVTRSSKFLPQEKLKCRFS